MNMSSEINTNEAVEISVQKGSALFFTICMGFLLLVFIQPMKMIFSDIQTDPLYSIGFILMVLLFGLIFLNSFSFFKNRCLWRADNRGIYLRGKYFIAWSDVKSITIPNAEELHGRQSRPMLVTLSPAHQKIKAWLASGMTVFKRFVMCDQELQVSVFTFFLRTNMSYKDFAKYAAKYHKAATGQDLAIKT